ncbi:hypothetical protein [Pseudomonas sp. UBA4194]|uniref:hypothetical protein n=1 Tax=Pseudomonas sp. UBA4194 TaxID=1947317 RepID=UPI0025DCA41C|nr:hypothetical protein [Pseudomonas sp. UBA4194]
MTTRTRKCMVALSLVAVTALYATAAWRAEQARISPQLQGACTLAMCMQRNAAFSYLR